MNDVVALYLDLMKRCLLDAIYERPEYQPVAPQGGWKRKFVELSAARGLQIVRVNPVDWQARREGLDWPATAHTMIGAKRLDNLQFC